MFQRYRAAFGGLFGMFVLCAAPALAQQVNAAYATVTCNAYSLSVSASGLVGTVGMNDEIDFTINPSPLSGGPPITGSIPFNPGKSDTFDGTVAGSFKTLHGHGSFFCTAHAA